MPTCLRCYMSFEESVPDKVNKEGINEEIATTDWCKDCNSIAMSVVYRQASAYFNMDRRRTGIYNPPPKEI